jgi:integrase
MLNTNHLSFIYSFLLSLAFLLLMHCARHTFASLAIEYGMPIDVIAKILGHTNVNMTRQIFGTANKPGNDAFRRGSRKFRRITGKTPKIQKR